MKSREQSDVERLVERILRDTAACQDPRIQLTNAPAATQHRALAMLRSRDLPVLSTEGACGPG